MNIDHPIMDTNEISRGGIVEDVPFFTSLALAQRLKRLEEQKPALHPTLPSTSSHHYAHLKIRAIPKSDVS